MERGVFMTTSKKSSGDKSRDGAQEAGLEQVQEAATGQSGDGRARRRRRAARTESPEPPTAELPEPTPAAAPTEAAEPAAPEPAAAPAARPAAARDSVPTPPIPPIPPAPPAPSAPSVEDGRRALIMAVAAFAVVQLAAYLLFFKPLADENAGLRNDIGKLAERVDSLSGRTDKIAGTVGDVAGRVGDVVGQVEDVAFKVDKAETGISGALNSTRIAQLAALRAAMISGRPFAERLAAVEATHRLSDETGVLLEAVRPRAPLGIPTAAQLRARYDRLPGVVADTTPPRLVRAGLATAQRLGNEVAHSIGDRANQAMAKAEELIRNGQEYVSYRMVARFSPRLGTAIAPPPPAEAPAAASPAPPPPPPPIHGKVRALLVAGDVAAARELVAERTRRPDVPTRAWLDAASARLAAQRAAAGLEAEIRAARSNGN